MQPVPAEVAERVVRESYGRLLAFLAAQFRDVTLAEALSEWPRSGIPLNPEAWLLTVARRRIIDRARHARIAAGATERLLMSFDEMRDRKVAPADIPDERLKLMYVCAHPAIEETAHAPLKLQMVLGLDAQKIAAAFVVSAAAMSQRLVRAKSKIRDAGVAFDLPDADRLAERTATVLQAVYASYSLGRDDPNDADAGLEGLRPEAIWLARLVVGLMPNDPEAMGLLALLLFCEARRSAGRGGEPPAFVPLIEQDCSLWAEPLMSEAEAWLRRAGALSKLARFQLEAAIQAVHADRRRTGATDWIAIRTLYEGLIARAPSLGALVSQAVVIAELDGPDAGLRELDRFGPGEIETYQPYWAVRAELLARAAQIEAALAAYVRAIALCTDAAARTFLQDRKRCFAN